MRALIQRVLNASVTIDGKVYADINQGLLVLVGVEDEDTEEDIDWQIKKITNLRIFNDKDEKMNLSLSEVSGEIMIVSQFTLFASTKKGNRPSFIRSANPNKAIPLYDLFVKKLNQTLPNQVKTGIFGSDMKVNLTNDGPVTIWLDSKNKE